MKDLKSLLIFLIILVLAGVTIWIAVAKKASNQISQSEQNYTVSSDLDSLDATDLDTGFNSQLEQVNFESSSF